MQYLYSTRELPLVLGGDSTLTITAYSDASLGTGPKGRSITGQIIKLNDKAGAVSAKSSATPGVYTSSFEAEMDEVATAMKSISRVTNILNELGVVFTEIAQLFSDNKAMIDFVHGKGVAKGVRHMELRMWFIRERYKLGNVSLNHMAGITIPTDKLTKLANKKNHVQFTHDIMGLGLLFDDVELVSDDDEEEDEDSVIQNTDILI